MTMVKKNKFRRKYSEKMIDEIVKDLDGYITFYDEEGVDCTATVKEDISRVLRIPMVLRNP